MNLLFDLLATQPDASTKRHGGGKYCEMLFFEICKRNIQFEAFYNSAFYINPEIIDCAKKNNIPLFDLAKLDLNQIVAQQKINAIYSALPERIFPFPNCKILGTIHGLRFLELPYDFFSKWQLDTGIIGLNTVLGLLHSLKKKEKKKYLAHIKSLVLNSNFHFATVSEYSKKFILSQIPELVPKNIPVFFPPSTAPSNIDIKKQARDYFLLVSANRFEKNCIRAIIALDSLYTKRKIPTSIKVKITGLTEPKFRYKLNNPQQFSFLGYVEEYELTSLYANAYAFIYPSLNEGFGYPPIEAMQFGTPVLASNRSSIPEACGNAALYFTPTSIREIRNRVLQICNKNTYNAYSKKALSHFKYMTQRQNEDCQKMVDWIVKNA